MCLKMGKHEFLSPKAISNRMKAKCRQKLRWYCQMCQKQCRDANGFKCHCMSKSHLDLALLVSENLDEFMDLYSEEFKDDFLELLRRRFGTTRVNSNVVYNEYIGYRDHVHMNATRWETLTEFTTWLGREGLCKVDQTPEGWCLQYIDHGPETIRRQEELEKKKKQVLDDEERIAKFIEEQVRRGREGKELEEEPVFTELKRESEEDKVAFKLFGSSSSSSSSSSSVGPAKTRTWLGSDGLKTARSAKRKRASHRTTSKVKRKKCALAEIIEMETKMKKSVRSDNWIQPGIVVKVVTKRLGGKYYKKKAVIREVRDRYTAIVKLIDSRDKLKLDQSHLETVIPATPKCPRLRRRG